MFDTFGKTTFATLSAKGGSGRTSHLLLTSKQIVRQQPIYLNRSGGWDEADQGELSTRVFLPKLQIFALNADDAIAEIVLARFRDMIYIDPSDLASLRFQRNLR